MTNITPQYPINDVEILNTQLGVGLLNLTLIKKSNMAHNNPITYPAKNTKNTSHILYYRYYRQYN
jgi:hypothetical protein